MMVQADFQNLLSSHQEPELLGGSVLENFYVADATFFPFVVMETEQLGTMAVQGIFILLPSSDFHFVRQADDRLKVYV